jgi:hypothetical protein
MSMTGDAIAPIMEVFNTGGDPFRALDPFKEKLAAMSDYELERADLDVRQARVIFRPGTDEYVAAGL